MRLLMSPASPFVRKVRVLLEEAGKADLVEEVPVNAVAVGETDAELTKSNPLGKIPALILNDGTALYDSRVIMRYLDRSYGIGLYPEDRLWDVLTLEATADAMMEAGLLMVYEKRFRPEHLQFGDWVEGQWSKIARSLDLLEEKWLGRLAEPLDAGQIGAACALGYLDFRHEGRNWRNGRPGLDAWFARIADRKSLKSTKPIG